MVASGPLHRRATAALLALCALLSAISASAHLQENHGGHHLWKRRVIHASGSVCKPSSTASASPTSASASASPTVFSTIAARRVDFALRATSQASNVSTWLSTLSPGGTWPDVDYTAGCAAQRASWPAADHWARIDTLAAAWHGGLPGAENWAGNASLKAGFLSAMDVWFANDFGNPNCLVDGGSSTCPCGTGGLWNTNWYSNVILVPTSVGQACVLASPALSVSQMAKCQAMLRRGYNIFYDPAHAGYYSGANGLLLAAIGVDLAILSTNSTLLAETYRQVESQLVLVSGNKIDGIKPDGSFGQHAGLLYTGNYGKDFANKVLALEIEAAGTQYAASSTAIRAFETFWDASQWMVVYNAVTSVLHWDLSVVGRFIASPVSDGMASSGLNINLTDVMSLGSLWGSSVLQNVYSNLAKNVDNANAGALVGNRVFQSNDYIVQRGANYVTTLKMYSARTLNTECVNSQNPNGFHLSDFALYTYVDGNEYEDVAGAWDWNLVPGSTVDYGNTPLNCNQALSSGLEVLVGGVSTGAVGAGAMKYTNPLTRSLSWQKAVFFLPDDTQVVMLSNVISSSSAPVLSVLDQRRHSGDVYVDDARVGTGAGPRDFAGAASLWHGGSGYLFAAGASATLTVSVAQEAADWSKIGISKVQGSADVFAAYLKHNNLGQPLQYIMFPGVSLDVFKQKSASRQIDTVANDADVAAVYDTDHGVLAGVFWSAAGGSVSCGGQTLSANQNVAVIVDFRASTLTVSDPTQSLSSVRIVLGNRVYNVALPTDPLAAGTSVTRQL